MSIGWHKRALSHHAVPFFHFCCCVFSIEGSEYSYSKKLKLSENATVNEMRAAIRAAFPQLHGNFQLLRCEPNRRLVALPNDVDCPAKLKACVDMRQSALYVRPESVNISCWMFSVVTYKFSLCIIHSFSDRHRIPYKFDCFQCSFVFAFSFCRYSSFSSASDGTPFCRWPSWVGPKHTAAEQLAQSCCSSPARTSLRPTIQRYTHHHWIIIITLLLHFSFTAIRQIFVQFIDITLSSSSIVHVCCLFRIMSSLWNVYEQPLADQETEWVSEWVSV